MTRVHDDFWRCGHRVAIWITGSIGGKAIERGLDYDSFRGF